MLFKTKGIVFRFTRFGETSIVVNIFTALFGLQSYMVNGIRTSSSKSKMALYQPLTLLDLVVYHRENANIMRIKEVQCYYAYQAINTDPVKSAQVMFLNEVLNKCVKEQSHAEELYEFLSTSLISLDRQRVSPNFHLIFLLKLGKYLGFGPQNTMEILGGRLLEEKEETLLERMIDSDYENDLSINTEQRRNLLESLLQFYAAHVDAFGEIKSVNVLRTILS